MNYISLIALCSWISVLSLSAQMTLEEVNYRLDTHPYFDLGIGYNSNLVLPDSIKNKIIEALNRKLPQHFADSIFNLQDAVLKNIEHMALQKCKTDSVCFKKEYNDIYNKEIESKKRFFYNECYAISLILSCGSWNIKEAIPYLEKELQNQQCKHQYNAINLALAKLGNDSIYRQIKESRSLSYLILHTELDSIDYQARYASLGDIFPYGISAFPAYYLKDKKLLYDMIDLLYLKGKVPFFDFDYNSIEVSLLMIYFAFLFGDYPQINTDSWVKICNHYLDIYIDADNDDKLYEQVSSHEYKRKIIEELRKWIDENVDFD
jgi:hypothetical protein